MTDSKEFTKFLPYNDNIFYQWFIVQYDESPQRFTRKVVRTDELIWNQELQCIECDDGERREHVLIRDQGKLHLGYIIYKTATQEDCMDHYRFLQMFFMQMLSLVKDKHLDQLYKNHNFWVMVIYNRCPEKVDQMVISIFHKSEVVFQVDHQRQALAAFIQEENVTYKAVVIKLNSDLKDMLHLMRFIKKEMLMLLLRGVLLDKTTRQFEHYCQVNYMMLAMARDCKQLFDTKKQFDKKKADLKLKLTYAMRKLQGGGRNVKRKLK